VLKAQEPMTKGETRDAYKRRGLRRLAGVSTLLLDRFLVILELLEPPRRRAEKLLLKAVEQERKRSKL